MFDDDVPAMTPYVSMSVLIDVANDERKNESDAMTPPTMHTIRQPNLLVSALAIGPTTTQG